MKKNQLIEILQNIKGNPDIKLWNSMVSDYVDIDKDIFVDELVKETQEHLYNALCNEHMFNTRMFDIPQGTKDILKEQSIRIHRESQYNTPNQFVTNDEFQAWYGKRTKKVVCIQPKFMNKRTFDRCGTIEY